MRTSRKRCRAGPRWAPESGGWPDGGGQRGDGKPAEQSLQGGLYQRGHNQHTRGGGHEHGHTLETVRFTEREICRKIQNLRSEAASGPDGIGPKILQELHEELASGLAHIFTKSLEEGAVPADWKEANVTPIFKKGAKSKPENYRPVSLTSVSCKIMESIFRDAMTEQLQNCYLIKKSQHGFLKDRSCVTNLLEFLEKAAEQMQSAWKTRPCALLVSELADWQATTCCPQRQVFVMGGRSVWGPSGECARALAVCHLH